MDNTFVTLEYTEEVKKNFTEFFKDKPVFGKHVTAQIALQSELQTVLRDMKVQRTLDNAFGVNLDIIGKIVGYDRILVNVNSDGYFAFQDVAFAKGFGEINDPALGGKLFSKEDVTTGNLELNDDLYRIALRAVIRASVATGNINDIVDTTNLIVQDGVLDIVDLGTGEVELYLSRTLTPFESILMFGIEGYDSIIPVPAGVKLTIIVPNRDLRTLYVEDGYGKPGYFEFKDAPYQPPYSGATLVLDFGNNNFLIDE